MLAGIAQSAHPKYRECAMDYNLDERLNAANKPAVGAMPGAIPPTLGNGLSGQSQVAQNTGYITGTEPGKAPAPMQKPGFDQNGVITAESAKAAMALPMERSGGIAGSIDMQGANAVLARENAVRQQMIDAQIPGGTGKPISWQDQYGNRDPYKEGLAERQATFDKWDRESAAKEAMRDMERNPKLAASIASMAANQNNSSVAVRGQDLNYGATMAQQGITARGQDLNNQRAAAHDQVLMRGQDITGGNDAKRLGIDRSRLGIQQADSARADAKWGIEGGILKGQAADSEMIRNARTELNTAISSGDPAKVEAAKAKAVAAGVKFDKGESPSSSYTPNQAGMPGGMAVTKNPDGSMVLVPVDSKGSPGKPSVISGKQPATDVGAQAANIKSQMQSGKITREQAVQQLQAMGYK